jgi:hypothetical protein
LVILLAAAFAFADDVTVVVFGKTITRDMGRAEVKQLLGVSPYAEDDVKGLTYVRDFDCLEGARETLQIVFSEEGTVSEVVWEVGGGGEGNIDQAKAETIFFLILTQLKEKYGEPGYVEEAEGRYGSYEWNAGETRKVNVKYDFWLNKESSGAKIFYSF